MQFHATGKDVITPASSGRLTALLVSPRVSYSVPDVTLPVIVKRPLPYVEASSDREVGAVNLAKLGALSKAF